MKTKITKDAIDMHISRRFIKYERHWIHFTIKRLAFAIILLAVCGNEFGLHNVNAWTDCTSYRTCAQCTTNVTCKWSFENQSCVSEEQSFPSNISGKSCPKIKLTDEIQKMDNSDDSITVIKIKLSISEIEDNLKNFLNQTKIKCKIDNTSHDAWIENDGSIACNYTIPDDFDNHGLNSEHAPNPLLIVYFTIVVNGGVPWKFDNDRDHYVDLYPLGAISRGKSCEITSVCTTGFWDDGPAQYYCKWCLANEACRRKTQEGKCYVRDTEKGVKVVTRGNTTVVHVKDGNVTIKGFDPAVGPVTGDINVTVHGHKVLAHRRNVSVTVAGHECQVLKKGESEIQCTVAVNATDTVRDGPVLVTYWSVHEQQAYEFSSADAFHFARPRIANVRGPTCGPLDGGTRLTVVGELLDSVRDVHVYLGEDVGTCDVKRRSDNAVECRTVPLTRQLLSDLAVPVHVTLDDVRSDYGEPFEFRFVHNDSWSVDANQTLRGIKSGGTRLTVRGRFECTQDPRVYVELNGAEKYEANCTITSGAAMVCRAPSVPLSVNTEDELLVGFRWTFGDQPNERIADGVRYALNPDPEFAYFDGPDPGTANVTIHGQHLDLDAKEVTVRVVVASADGDVSRECVVQRIEPTWIACLAVEWPSAVRDGNRSAAAADARSLEISVGADLKRTVYPTPDGGASVGQHESQRLLAGVVVPVSIFSATVALLLALALLARAALTRSGRRGNKRYAYELGNVAAGKPDEKHSFLSSL